MKSLGVTILITCVFPVAVVASTALTWIRGSSVKVEQMIGDCDYTSQAATGQCKPTTSRTSTRANLLGTDLGASFESQGNLIFLFGDSIGPAENYFASDTMASSTSTDPAHGLFLDVFTKTDGTPFFVRVPGVRLGGNEVPNAGIHLDKGTFIVCNSGMDRNLPTPDINAYSVLTRFDETARTFTLLRTISTRPNGKFITPSLHASGSDVMMFGLGAYRASDVYLATIPASSFDTGAGTRYFAGLVNGQPAWSGSESAAVPVVAEKGGPGIGNVSVIHSPALGLWLMTYDGGRQSPSTAGVYFTYAKDPWGPWAEPQLIFNQRRDGANGKFVHDPSVTPNDGLNGPTIGGNDPRTTPGGVYAPYMIERFTRVSGSTLSIYYALSTWNPYTIVLMRADLTIAPAAARARAVRH